MTDTNGTQLDLSAMIRLREKARGLLPGLRSRALSPGPSSRRSMLRGRGMEFDEVRLYQPGDDARNIDWRVTARRGEPYTKLFREERDRPVFILADLHPGMYFGTRRVFKSVLSMELATLIAWAAEAAGDRVGGLIANHERHDELAPRNRQPGVLQLLHSLDRMQPRTPGELRSGQLDRLLTRSQRIVHPGSLVIVLSDFQQAGPALEAGIHALRQHNDLRIGFISDPLEETPPRVGMLRMGSPALNIDIDTASATLREHWQTQFRQRLQQIEDLCEKTRTPFRRFATADDPLTALRGLL
jgi:uncharacterized protein (DUF58 family)